MFESNIMKAKMIEIINRWSERVLITIIAYLTFAQFVEWYEKGNNEVIYLYNKIGEFIEVILAIPFIIIGVVILIDCKKKWKYTKLIMRMITQSYYHKYIDGFMIAFWFIGRSVEFNQYYWGLIGCYFIWLLFRLSTQKEKRKIIDDTLIEDDNAIKSKNEEVDYLGRRKFSEQLVDIIVKFRKESSLIMALYGEWGSGKSSVLELMKIDLEEKKTEVIVLEFNPWYFSNKENLLTNFLEFYYQELVKNHLCRDSQIGSLIRTYMNRLGKMTMKVEGLSFLLHDFLPIDKNEKSIEELKAAIDDVLKKVEKRIVIFIDDIDRLNPNEIRQLFALPKLIADFSNTTYVLSFDNKVVAKVLAKEYGWDNDDVGEQFLEKIVQVAVKMPIADIGLVEKVLLTKLEDKRLDINVGDSRFVIFRKYALKIIAKKPIRKMKIFLNALEIGKFLAKQHDINEYDFIYVEFLRVYFYEVYEYILDYKDVLVSAYDEFFLTLDPDKRRKITEDQELKDKFFESGLERINNWKNLSSLEMKAVQSILHELFPRFEDFEKEKRTVQAGGSKTGENEERVKRICSVNSFDKYFLYDVPSNEIAEGVFEEFLNCVKNEEQEAIIKYLNWFTDLDKLEKLLDKLNINSDRITHDKLACEKLVMAIGGFIKSSKLRVRVGKLIISLLEKLQNRVVVLEKVIASNAPLWLSVDFYNRFSVSFNLLELPKEELNKLKEKISDKIRCEVNRNGLNIIDEYEDDFERIMLTWKAISNSDVVKETLKKWLIEEENIEKFLKAFYQKDPGMAYSKIISIFPVDEMVEIVKPYCQTSKECQWFLNEYKFPNSDKK